MKHIHEMKSWNSCHEIWHSEKVKFVNRKCDIWSCRSWSKIKNLGKFRLKIAMSPSIIKLSIIKLLLAWLVEHSLVHWDQQCVTVHPVPKCMSYHGAMGRLIGNNREDTLSVILTTYIYYTHLTSVRFQRYVCHDSIYLYIYIRINYWRIV